MDWIERRERISRGVSETWARLSSSTTNLFQNVQAQIPERVSKAQERLSEIIPPEVQQKAQKINQDIVQPTLQVVSQQASHIRENHLKQAVVDASNNFFSTIGKVPRYRQIIDWAYPSTINSFEESKFTNVNNKVVFTIDDGPCRGSMDKHMVTEVLELLRRYDAKATFFLISSFVHQKEELVKMILDEGHEIGNHMPDDRPYHQLSEEDFEFQLLTADATLSEFVDSPIRVFRPPNGKMSKAMESVLNRHGYISVFGDAYGNDAWCEDGARCAQIILQNSRPGSIIACHMPEKGYREWTLTEMELTLQGLQEKGCEVVSFSEMRRTCKPCQTESEEDPNVSKPVPEQQTSV